MRCFLFGLVFAFAMRLCLAVPKSTVTITTLPGTGNILSLSRFYQFGNSSCSFFGTTQAIGRKDYVAFLFVIVVFFFLRISFSKSDFAQLSKRSICGVKPFQCAHRRGGVFEQLGQQICVGSCC